MALSLAACGSGSEKSAIADTDAREQVVAGPTIGELEKQGLVRVDDESVGADCGPNCTVDGFTAVYMGEATKSDGQAVRKFKCPVAPGEMESWKCQELKVSNG
jgi:hypothetical protein